MFKVKNSIIRKLNWILLSIISINILFTTNNSYAFVPSLNEPSTEELKKTSLKIGKTAKQFIFFGRPQEGISFAKLAISLNPKEVELWIILIEGQMKSNLLSEALLSIQSAKKINPEVASLWFAEGSIALRQKKLEYANKSIKQGLLIDQNNAWAYFELGNTQIMQNKLRKALKTFEKAANIDPKFWQAINNKAIVLYELDKRPKAIKTWRSVLEIEADAEPKLALASALNKKQPGNQEAIELAIEALRENPDYVSQKHQEDQLWGKKLQKAAKELLKSTALENARKSAFAKSTINN